MYRCTKQERNRCVCVVFMSASNTVIINIKDTIELYKMPKALVFSSCQLFVTTCTFISFAKWVSLPRRGVALHPLVEKCALCVMMSLYSTMCCWNREGVY